MDTNQKYKSVHEYLDVVFKNQSPNNDAIVKAKKEYRKLYQQWYQEKYQQKRIQISFRISKKQFDTIKKQASILNQKPNQWVRLKILENKSDKDTLPLKLKLAMVIDTIEDAVFQGTALDSKAIILALMEIEKLL